MQCRLLDSSRGQERRFPASPGHGGHHDEDEAINDGGIGPVPSMDNSLSSHPPGHIRRPLQTASMIRQQIRAVWAFHITTRPRCAPPALRVRHLPRPYPCQLCGRSQAPGRAQGPHGEVPQQSQTHDLVQSTAEHAEPSHDDIQSDADLPKKRSLLTASSPLHF